MDKLLSLVVPVYNEEECIGQFISETRQVLEREGFPYEVVFIDDGSSDRTVQLIREALVEDQRIKLVELSYNQGKQVAVTAGIHYAKGELLLYMDPDLQDPPEEITRFVVKIEEGFDLVFGVREEKRDSAMNKVYSKMFWSTLEKFTKLKIPRGLAVMRIFNRKFADQFQLYNEQNRFIEGMFMHIGMKRTQITIQQRERFAGKSKYNFKRKMQLAFTAITDFSDLPLKLTIRFGLLLTALGVVALLGLIVAKLFITEFQMGWPSIVSILITGFGLQILFMGVIGKYVGNIYKESKRRPLFSVRELHNLQ